MFATPLLEQREGHESSREGHKMHLDTRDEIDELKLDDRHRRPWTEIRWASIPGVRENVNLTFLLHLDPTSSSPKCQPLLTRACPPCSPMARICPLTTMPPRMPSLSTSTLSVTDLPAASHSIHTQLLFGV
jgi:hypothetical protein